MKTVRILLAGAVLGGAVLGGALVGGAIAQQPAAQQPAAQQPAPKPKSAQPRTEQSRAPPDTQQSKPVETACQTPHLERYPKDEALPPTDPTKLTPPDLHIPVNPGGGQLCRLDQQLAAAPEPS